MWKARIRIEADFPKYKRREFSMAHHSIFFLSHYDYSCYVSTNSDIPYPDLNVHMFPPFSITLLSCGLCWVLSPCTQCRSIHGMRDGLHSDLHLLETNSSFFLNSENLGSIQHPLSREQNVIFPIYI